MNKKKVLFHLEAGQTQLYNLALNLNKEKYRKFIIPIILTSSKFIAGKAENDGLYYVFFKPFYDNIKKIRLADTFSLSRLVKDLFLFKFYKIELKNIVKKINPDLLFLGTDVGYNENIVLSNLGIKTIVNHFSIDSTVAAEEEEYMRFQYKNRKFSLLERLIDKIIKKSPDYNCRFGNLKGPYFGYPLRHFVLKFFKILPKCERTGGGNSAYFAIAGYGYIDVFCDYGIPKSKLVVTGNPEHDNILENTFNKTNIMKNVYKNFKLENKKIVMIFLQTLHTLKDFVNYDYITSIKLILNSLLKYKEKIHVIVKCHPRTNKRDYIYLEKMFQCTVIGNEIGFSNEELIISSEFMITFSSTVGRLGFILKVPVISFNFGLNAPNSLKNTGGTFHCQSIDEFDKVIDELLQENGSMRNNIIEKGNVAVEKFLKLDGKCVDRIFNILK